MMETKFSSWQRLAGADQHARGSSKNRSVTALAVPEPSCLLLLMLAIGLSVTKVRDWRNTLCNPGCFKSEKLLPLPPLIYSTLRGGTNECEVNL